MDTDSTAAWAAEVMNAGWFVRNCRLHDRTRRAQALAKMAGAVRAGLDAGAAAEPILYAVASALYDRGDPRFQV